MGRIAPSILGADFSDLYASVRAVEDAELLHLDVMDGHFVPNISFGPPVIDSLRARTDMYFDAHLMIENPERYLGAVEEAGADRLTVHAEACEDLRAVVGAIHERGLDAGVAFNPETPVDAVADVLDDVETVLVMTVEPGFGGQAFVPETLAKVEQVDGMTDAEVEVDGGIDRETGRRCAEAGADTFVVGSSLFGRPDPRAALSELRRHILQG